ncbi:restriction endonuclease subunit S [Campylobacter sp. TTU_617]|uniref:restriction endonuclease subunit S n=1 Tax=Campylobacter sp. TTU_617 TaxID=2768148 RepID=UPI001907900E|nr:restriction endonuclease subunit S [Campylobacter sp. TTU_617]MBK1971660.1 restriction endonuclease subunit S [Campylobacter sp. TTU_617]
MKNDLASVEWKEFKISEAFENFHGKRLVEKQRIKGKIPLLTAGENNNAIASFINNASVIYEDFISIDMFGNAFYHPYKASGDDNIYFFLNQKLSKYVKLFIVCCINMQKSKYSYGKQFRQTNADNCKIMLPIDSKGNPNYSFMEGYMKEIEQNYIKSILSYYNKKLLSYGGGVLPNCNNTFREQSIFIEDGLMKIAGEKLKLENIEWKEFTLEQIFSEIKRGKRLIEKDRIKGNIPYYSASKENNGLTDLISNPLFVEKDKIIITTFCDCYYIEGNFTASDEITMLGNEKLNKYNGLFLANIIKNNASKFAFGYKAFTERLKRQIIQLPKDEMDNPNWQFMEDYMKAIEKEHLEKITAYYNAKLNENNWGGGFDLDEYKKFIQNQKQLENVEWREFKINEIFNVYTGGDLILSKIKKGNIPIISHSVLNNGISSWSSQIKDRKIFNYKTTISLADRGNFFAFTQMQNFYIGTRVKALEIKYNVDFDVLKFICVCINKQSDRFSYGRNCCANIEFLNIILPIDSKGSPNWQFMEDYIKHIEYKKIKDIVVYYQRKS